jgi:hypothetical protein
MNDLRIREVHCHALGLVLGEQLGAAISRTSLIRISNKKSTRECNPAVACSPKKHAAFTRRVKGNRPLRRYALKSLAIFRRPVDVL